MSMSRVVSVLVVGFAVSFSSLALAREGYTKDGSIAGPPV